MTQEARAGFSQIVWPVPWFAFNWVRTKFNFSFQYRPLVDQFQAFNRVTHGMTSPPTPLSILRGTERECSAVQWGCPNKQTSMLNWKEMFTSDCYCFAGRYNAAPITKIRSFFEKEAKTIDHLKAFQAATSNDFVNVWEHLQSERGCKFWAALAC